MKRVKSYNVLLGGLVLSAILSGAVLASTTVSADDVIDDVAISIPVACTMTGTINTPHTANVESGTYVADIGTTTLKAVCNDANGFSIYAIGYSNQEYGNNKMLATVGGTLAPTYDITTGIAQNGNTSNWAMKLNSVTGTYAPTILSDFDSYHAVPDTYTKVATRTAGTDATVGANIQSTYAVYVTSTQPAGSYNGKVKYTMVYPNDADAPLQPQTTQAGQICYYPNGSNVEGSMGCQTIFASYTSTTLLASNFSRAGYGFAGWSKTFDYSDDTGYLGPQETITFTAGQYTGSNPGLSLYARWIKSAGNLQNWSGCSSLQSGAVTALTDQRDNETYAVAKLADGNCWMIENMRLENTGTDNTNGSLAQGYNASFAGLANPEAPWANNSNIANSLYSIYDSTDKTISGSRQGYRFPRYNNVNTPTTATDRPSTPTSNSATNSTTDASMYSYGNYYTWAAAIADTTDYTTNNQSVTSTSICPTGWHLPKGGDKSNEANNDFWALVVTGINGGINPANYDSSTTPDYTGTPEGSDASNALRAYPNNFVYSGDVGGGYVLGRGSDGNYWSSTSYSGNYAYHMYFGSSYVYPGTNFRYKYNGRSIRCLASGA
ncbi:hypothetical protein IKD98_03475 [Candidatus Saccharibacteria bacterium]|nr:hypothetical protein [Candidatus Saccharibacteria bacterium]